MAQAVRQQHRLPALRISLVLSRSGDRVCLEPFLGRKSMGEPAYVPADSIGIQPRLRPGEYERVEFRLDPQVVKKVLADLRGPARKTGSFWLQIERSSGTLAVVPWERLLEPFVAVPILRIPNFVVDPYYLEGRLVLAICASSPRAKSPFPVSEYVRALVGEVQRAVVQGTIIHVFADREAYSELADPKKRTSASPHEVIVHNPATADRFGIAPTRSELADGGSAIESPWLRWIQQELGDRRLDAAHFVCPGYFYDDRGALALAAAPSSNVDRSWSHFIGAGELASALNMLGAWAVAFSPPSGDVWALGLRLLAEQLAWKRPGPVMVCEAPFEAYSPWLGRSHWSPPGGELLQAYSFLFGHEFRAPPKSAFISLYCHPRRLAALARDSAPVETVSSTRSERRRGITSLETEDQGFDEFDLQVVAMKKSREDAASTVPGSQPTWKVAGKLSLEQAVMALEERGGAAREGSAAAIRLLNDLMEGVGQTDAELPDLGRYLRNPEAQSFAARIRKGWTGTGSAQ